MFGQQGYETVREDCALRAVFQRPDLHLAVVGPLDLPKR
jgi:hypothetical protein